MKAPRFKVGDLVEFDLTYAKVVYLVEAIRLFKHKKIREPCFEDVHYELRGVKILEHDNSNKHMTEARHYDPFCYWFDEKAKPFEGTYERVHFNSNVQDEARHALFNRARSARQDSVR